MKFEDLTPDRRHAVASEIVAREQRFNRATRPCWDLFAPHRRRVTELLLNQPAEQRGGLSVLGAGNCNDLDLHALCATFAAVHLVDLDAQALADGVIAQGLDAGRGPLHLHGGVDVTGIAERLDGWSPTQPPNDAQLRDCLLAAGGSRVELPRPVDVAVSVCLLSQLMEILNVTLGGQHPQFTRLAALVRSRHVELLVDSVQPGGRAVIVTDVTSSDLVPELGSVSQGQLPALLERIMRDGRFLSGVNPFHLQRLCREQPGLARRVSAVRVSHPWVWQFPGRTYVVCAVEIRRAHVGA
ncbi:MAG: hypothetical protein AABP62_31030 [Planctomycetota bacterium]